MKLEVEKFTKSILRRDSASRSSKNDLALKTTKMTDSMKASMTSSIESHSLAGINPAFEDTKVLTKPVILHKMTLSEHRPSKNLVYTFECLNPTSTPTKSMNCKLVQLDAVEEAYIVRAEIGRGTFGRVLLTTCRKTKYLVVLKAISKHYTKLDDFRREVAFSYFLSPHANIVNTYDVAFETCLEFVFAQEFAPYGDLYHHIPKDEGLPEQDAKRIIRQVASALDFLHSKGLVHRDIKPENVFVYDDKLRRVKLGDFGMTRKVGTHVRQTRGGSNPYTSPEVSRLPSSSIYSVTPAIDIWALGVVMFCILTGRFPWEQAKLDDQYYQDYLASRLGTGGPSPRQGAWKRFRPSLLHLLHIALEPGPDRRCSARQFEIYCSTDQMSISTTGMYC